MTTSINNMLNNFVRKCINLLVKCDSYLAQKLFLHEGMCDYKEVQGRVRESGYKQPVAAYSAAHLGEVALFSLF